VDEKTLLQLLGQLHMAPGLDLRSIQKLNNLLTYHEEVIFVSYYKLWLLNFVFRLLVKQCPFENVVNEKLFDKFSKRFNGLYKEGLEEIKSAGAEFLDEEFRDIYQRIGVDVPEDGEVRGSRSRGKWRAKESDGDAQEPDKEPDEEAAEEDEEEPGENEEGEVIQNE
jgi:condensin complex subunit 3